MNTLTKPGTEDSSSFPPPLKSSASDAPNSDVKLKKEKKHYNTFRKEKIKKIILFLKDIKECFSKADVYFKILTTFINLDSNLNLTKSNEIIYFIKNKMKFVSDLCIGQHRPNEYPDTIENEILLIYCRKTTTSVMNQQVQQMKTKNHIKQQ